MLPGSIAVVPPRLWSRDLSDIPFANGTQAAPQGNAQGVAPPFFRRLCGRPHAQLPEWRAKTSKALKFLNLSSRGNLENAN